MKLSDLNNIIKKLFTFLNKYHWYIIIICQLLFAVVLWRKGYLHYEFYNDLPSYLLHDFSSIRGMLGAHRTIGLPVILKVYGVIFSDFTIWPFLQLIFYFLSILFLYFSLRKSNFNLLICLIITSHLIWNVSICVKFRFVVTEPITVGFLNITLGLLVWSFRQRKCKIYIALGFSSFILYQIRPNMGMIVFLLPLWAAGIYISNNEFSIKGLRNILLKYSSITCIPLSLFLIIRWSATGHIGIVSFTGLGLSGHATYFLNESHIEQLTGESKIIAEKILDRKKKLSYPWNLTPFKKSYMPGKSILSMQNAAHSSHCMSAWLAAIKYKTGLEPFNDSEKNVEPWKNVRTLSGFFSIYNVEIDKLLMKYSINILRLEWQKYIKWITLGAFLGLKDWTMYLINIRIYQIWLVLLGLLVSIKLLFYIRKNKIDENLESMWYKEVKLISVFGVSLVLFNIPPITMFSLIHPEYVSLFSVYIFPVITLWCFPPALGAFGWTHLDKVGGKVEVFNKK